jgi:apolipoprotein N-acyltransferase
MGARNAAHEGYSDRLQANRAFTQGCRVAQRSTRIASADKLSRLALLEREEKRQQESAKITITSVPLRLALAAVAGLLLLLAQTGALWAWIGASALMLSVAGAEPEIGAAAGAIAALIAYFRVLGDVNATGAFWLVMLFHAGGGAVAGALASLISRRLPPVAFPFLAALLPAGLEHLGSFGITANLSSTALTQYAHPFIVRMARLGGLAGVTYVIFVFGGAVAIAVRYLRNVSTILTAALPAAGLVLVGFIYGIATNAATESRITATAFNCNSVAETRKELFAKSDYDAAAWSKYVGTVTEAADAQSEKPVVTNAIARSEEAKTPQLTVWPEAVVAVDAKARKSFLSRVAAMAKKTKCVQVAPYYDIEASTSKVTVTDDSGDANEGYSRMNFIHGVDDNLYGIQISPGGTMPPKIYSTAIGKIGALLSIDANYFENFERLGRQGAGIVAVSGYDDAKVPEISMRLLVYNAARAGVAVVRSTGNGFMTVIDPNGDIVEEMETQSSVDSALVMPVRLGIGSTIAFTVGNAFAWLALLGGIIAGLFASTIRESAPPSLPRRGEYGPLTYRTKEGAQDV